MVGTRSSARLNDNGSAQPEPTKRKAEDSPSGGKSAKKGKPSGTQQTLEETISKTDEQEGREQEGPDVVPPGPQSEQSNDQSPGADLHGKNGAGSQQKSNEKANDNGNTSSQEQTDTNANGQSGIEKTLKESTEDKGVVSSTEDKAPATADEEVKAPQQADVSPHDADKEPSTNTNNGGAIQEDAERERAQPSNVLEKGIIYFFTRGRVEIDEPESVTDIQRTHLVLRPLPEGAKIGSGAMDDTKNNRLIAVPKKVLPKSGSDRFMAFVEKAGVSNTELKDEFLKGSEYETATLGTRHVPPATPVGEGVYAITSTGDRGESHLAYLLTIPQEPGALQRDLGVREKGSFILSLKNPEVKGPANASLPDKPAFPKDVIEAFGARSWMPVEPKHLDYANAQILLIGEDLERGHALEATGKDERDEQKETPGEEMEKLEREDELRVKHLSGDDSIFDDLGVSKKDYPAVKTTW